MMMMPDKKNISSIIVSKMRPGKLDEVVEKVESGEPQSDYSAALDDAAKKMMDAFDSKDVKKFSAHLKDFIDMCGSNENGIENSDN